MNQSRNVARPDWPPSTPPTKLPGIRIYPSIFVIRLLFSFFLTTFCLSVQARDPFWKRKTQDKPAKAQDKLVRDLCAMSKVTKRPTKKKTAESSDPPEDVDESEQEVELDSLGSFSYTLLTMTVPRMMRKPAALTMSR